MKNMNLSYAQKFKAMNREALATLVLAVIIAVFFWGAIFALKDSGEFLFSMPAWCVVSCIGGYALSVIGVIIVVRLFMADFPLDDREDPEDER